MSEVGTGKKSFEKILRKTFSGLLDTIAGFLLGLGLKPNHITLAGLCGNIIAAVLIGSGRLMAGGLMAALMGPLDAVDGAMARKIGVPTRFGGFLDSVIDRYDELLLLGGVLVYFTRGGNTWGIYLTYAAAAGSVLVSYMRARAEALGFDGKVGLLTRVERYIILILGLLLNWIIYSVGIIAVLGNATALQRLLYVKKQADHNGRQN
ncbi:MAG TPA: CDP-alcohol phosphatidyltransferase family protein [Anaerolineaceae bacterium]|jgi:CDP-diacylglycerol--glycerol-3-phosphate 3-phosphatidyltransferase|nr:CDP-alcohol phosphatidyltransferase family protein [Anaerolineaceae bacterium]NMD26809.1 CDP-alcohol phosphatidyltransferase family protein [Chloroflexota bacterium]HOA21309.1 CDP-alcohol phosphatidyltransferase family protein [Anaerolineaceae bacterium]HOG77392.1 CDP-alcohol phosphatidyltransferase family protein [Anaerolineaceae bacterium]